MVKAPEQIGHSGKAQPQFLTEHASWEGPASSMIMFHTPYPAPGVQNAVGNLSYKPRLTEYLTDLSPSDCPGSRTITGPTVPGTKHSSLILELRLTPQFKGSQCGLPPPESLSLLGKQHSHSRPAHSTPPLRSLLLFPIHIDLLFTGGHKGLRDTKDITQDVSFHSHSGCGQEREASVEGWQPVSCVSFEASPFSGGSSSHQPRP